MQPVSITPRDAYKNEDITGRLIFVAFLNPGFQETKLFFSHGKPIHMSK